MTEKGDYPDEMVNRRLTDAEIEAVFTNSEPSNPELAEIADRFRALRAARATFDPTQHVDEFAKTAAGLARTGNPVKLAATARLRRGPSLTPRLAAAAVAAFLLVGTAGTAVAADSAAPGDFLYGIDRALESVGIGNGGVLERVAEANILTERGKSADALEHLAEHLPPESSSASDALFDASERIRSNEKGPEDVIEFRGEVADLLEFLSTYEFRNRDFGQEIAERAKELGNRPEENTGRGQGQGQGQGQRQGQGQGQDQGKGQGAGG